MVCADDKVKRLPDVERTRRNKHKRPRDQFALPIKDAAAFERETQAARALAEAQAVALAPKDGWWRPKLAAPGVGAARTKYPLTLRDEAVLDAYSVGCTRAQISKASGASATQVDTALIRIGVRRNRRRHK